MYYKIQDHNLLIKKEPRSNEIILPLSDFSFITSVCPALNKNEIFLTGVDKGAKLPNLKNNKKGDIRLYKITFGNSKWDCIYSKYAHDPVWIPGKDQIAFHNGNGISVVDEIGNLVFQYKQGKFNWGAPSVSSSPGGQRITFIKWQGDNQKIRSIKLSNQTIQEYRPSCHRYSWYDDDYLIYFLSSGLKLLELNTGRSIRFIQDLQPIAQRHFLCQDVKVRNFLLSEDKKEYFYNGLRCQDDLIYFGCQISTPMHSTTRKFLRGLFSIDKAKSTLELVYLFDTNLKLVSFEIDYQKNILMEVEQYEIARVIARHSIPVGPNKDFLNQGWKIFRDSTSPEFGFHYIGHFD